MSVVIYSSAMCPFCWRAKALLKERGASFEEINVDMKPRVRAGMRQKAGGDNKVPQIWIGDRHVGGCDALYALDARGELSNLIKAAG